MADQKVKIPKEGHDPVDRVADLIFGDVPPVDNIPSSKKEDDG